MEQRPYEPGSELYSEQFDVKFFQPDRPVDGGTMFFRDGQVSEAHTVNFFAPDRPTGGTVFNKPETADEPSASDRIESAADVEAAGPAGFEVKYALGELTLVNLKTDEPESAEQE